MKVQWVGHASALVEVGGHRILTDPLLTRRVAHLRRRRPLPTPDVADVDTVLLSHAHLDHLHLPSLRGSARTPAFSRRSAPDASSALPDFADVTEVRVGDRIDLDGPLVTAEVVPAAHKHGRGPHSRVSAPPVGYVVSGEGRRVYFPGDTDLFDAMADLTDIDIALLPIWGWGSSLGNGTPRSRRGQRPQPA